MQRASKQGPECALYVCRGGLLKGVTTAQQPPPPPRPGAEVPINAHPENNHTQCYLCRSLGNNREGGVAMLKQRVVVMSIKGHGPFIPFVLLLSPFFHCLCVLSLSAR